jgi:hypothetical protein
LGISLTELARRFGISVAGVGYSQRDKRRSRRRLMAMAGQVAQGTGKQHQFHQFVKFHNNAPLSEGNYLVEQCEIIACENDYQLIE